jgi:curved DNA-binding protein CbpA
MSDEFVDLYETLNVSSSASPEEIRNGYLNMSRLHHPDKTQQSSGEMFKNINRAYKILNEPTLRAFYDKHGFEPTIIAESTFDEQVSAITQVDDKLKFLESRVRAMLRSSEELRVQKFLQPSASISMGSRILSWRSPFYHTWTNTSSNAGLSLHSGKYSVSLYQSSFVQRGGAAVSRASIILSAAFSPLLSGRSVIHVMGGRLPGVEVMVQKQLTDETVIRQSLVCDEVKVNSTGGPILPISISTEWVQQLGEVIVGTLGVTLGQTRGVSLELAKKIGGALDLPVYLRKLRAKARIGLMSNGDISIGGKLKYVVVDGLEVHAGPQLSIGTGLSFELTFHKELEAIVEEQEGAFPTYLQWSIGLHMPDEVSVGLKLIRGSFSFHIPIELPAPETKWALIGILAAWTFAPIIATASSKFSNLSGKRR